MPDESVNKWILGLVVGGAPAVFIWMAKLVFDRLIVKRIDQVQTDFVEFAKTAKAGLESIVSSIKDHDHRFSLGNHAFGDLRDKVNDLREELRSERDENRRRDIELAEIQLTLKDVHEELAALKEAAK